MLIIHDLRILSKKGPDISGKECEILFLEEIKRILETFRFKGEKFWDIAGIEGGIIKKSLDLRQKEPRIVIKGFIGINNETGLDPGFEKALLSFLLDNNIKAREASEPDILKISPSFQNILLKNKLKFVKKPKVVIAGMGPAGIFAAVALSKNGIRPVIIEKGKKVEDRIKDVAAFFSHGRFNGKSNVVFGEGGAGTFSDGKLTSRKEDPIISFILDFLVKMGAREDILTEHRPHIGSDGLILVLKNIRKYLIENGVDIFFEEELEDIIIDPEVKSLDHISTDKRIIKCDALILATGSNNYKIYEMLDKKGIFQADKPFAVGFRIEHKRDFINSLFLGKAAYKDYSGDSVYYNISSRDFGGYSFCMCPGGIVINSSSEAGSLCINGMSYASRNCDNSNSAIVAPVRAEMLEGYGGKLGALKFRRDIEKIAFDAGGGNFSAPVQPALEFVRDVAGPGLESERIAAKVAKFNYVLSGCKINNNLLPEPSYRPGVKLTNLNGILPSFLNMPIAGSLIEFEAKHKGFMANAILTGVETGTSSAVRIERGDTCESISARGVYPCGEGSGYSGGIVTSAMDGIKCALNIVSIASGVQ